ncbi:MAG TPA: alpha/beta fold hydrolase, partial [Flavisolibacter sp.]|nr:alpha/beta fold hydrolase [Flavisolibacter sp.]
MQERSKRRLRRWLITLVLTYLAVDIALYFGQELFLFHPKQLPMNHRFNFKESFQELNLPYQDHTISLVKFKARQPRKGLVLFFHGNMENIEHYRQYPAFFLRNGYDIWMIDYPGFGKTTGDRSESRICQDALYFYEQALLETTADSLVLYGKSLGTGVASFVASERKARQLILETPYYSID